MVDENPLLEGAFPIPFDRVEARHVEPAVDRLLTEAEQRLSALREAEEPPTFENTILALDRLTTRLHRPLGVVAHLEAVRTSPALREAFNEAQPRVRAFDSKLPLDPALWRRVSAFAETDEAAALTGARKRHLDKTVRELRRHGADLGTEDKQRLEAIDVELTKLTLRYAQNVLDATTAFELYVDDEQRLAGLPERAKKAAAEAAAERGRDGFRLSLQAPSLVPAVTYLDDRALRETLYRAASTRATAGEHDNRPLIGRIVSLRREKAAVLGYDTFADLVLEERMAENAAEAKRFVEDLERRTRPAFEREHEELQGFRRELEGPNAPDLAPWDLAYYAEKLRKSRYQLDSETLRPYFELERVLVGLFTLVERVFGVSFRRRHDVPVWHEDVRAYAICDDDRELALVYVDPYPREDKRDGAWMMPLVGRGGIEDDPRHAAALVANLTPPVGGGPALLSHRDVETLFHETGHLLHHCLSQAELPSQAGTNVAWDFVELPSQIMENWCWERESLDLFARHHETGETIDETLLDRMRRARTFRAATSQMRQLGFASTDLKLHTEYDPERDGDPIAYCRDNLQRFSPAPLPDDYAMVASFDHLFADPVGYAAGYYSYKWAEVLDADAFTRFRDEGLLSGEVGGQFRTQVLERGDEEDPGRLFERFMGRGPKLEALIERLGLAP